MPVFLPGESHGQRSLVGYSPRGHKESDRTEATEHTHSTYIDIFNIFSYLIKFQKFHCCYSFAKLCPTLCDPMDCSTPGFPVLHYLQEFAQTHSIKSVIPSNHLILCRPLLLLTSIFPSIRVFSNESALCIRLSKYWSFSIRSI